MWLHAAEPCSTKCTYIAKLRLQVCCRVPACMALAFVSSTTAASFAIPARSQQARRCHARGRRGEGHLLHALLVEVRGVILRGWQRRAQAGRASAVAGLKQATWRPTEYKTQPSPAKLALQLVLAPRAKLRA